MAEPMDPEILVKYLNALSQYKTTGFVDFNGRSQAWILETFGCDPKLIAQEMYRYVKHGGTIKRVREQGDPSIYANEFHDDLGFPFRGHELYVETLFFDDRDPDWCRIEVVNIKYNNE